MNINKKISSWEEFSIPNSNTIVYRRMTEDSGEVAAVVFGREHSWKWMILDDGTDVASGDSKNSMLGKFMVDLNLSELMLPNNISNIFKIS